MVEDIEMPVKVRVLIADGIKAVRARRDDFPLAFGHALESVVEGLNVLLRHHLEQELVAGAAGGIAGAGLAGRKHAELHASGVQQIHDGAGGAAAIVVIGTGAAYPEEVFHIGEIGGVLANDGYLDAIGTRLIDPGAALGIIAAPRVALGLHVLK